MPHRIEHITRFEYSSPVFSNRNIVRMTPRGVRRNWTIRATPAAASSGYVDVFGNDVTLLHLSGQHESLIIEASGEVESAVPCGPVHEEYLQESWLVDFCDLSVEIARERSVPGILASVRSRMEYRKGTTSVSTKSSEALQQGYGVCQDFAHVALAALRQAGHPSRYVGGYCYGEGATHAWVDVMVDGVWHVYDPTHEYADSGRLIAVAVGRDYRDTSPVVGTYLGAATAVMTATVKVTDGTEEQNLFEKDREAAYER